MKTDPLLSELKRLQRDSVSSDALAERHADEVAEWARTQESLEMEVDRLRQLLDLAVESMSAGSTVVHAAAAPAPAPPPLASAAGDGAVPSTEMASLREELKAAKRRSAALNAELSIEKSRHMMLERSFEAQRQRLAEALAANPLPAQQQPPPEPEPEEEEEAAAAASSSGGGTFGLLRKRLSAGSRQPTSPQAVEQHSLQLEVKRLEEALRDETMRRRDLETLREAFAERFTPGFVQNLEKELAMLELGLSAKEAAEQAALSPANKDASVLRARPLV